MSVTQTFPYRPMIPVHWAAMHCGAAVVVHIANSSAVEFRQPGFNAVRHALHNEVVVAVPKKGFYSYPEASECLPVVRVVIPRVVLIESKAKPSLAS